MQASSDLNVLDFDIPFAFIFVVAPTVELTAALIIMTYVTWQVIIIALLALAATKVVQVNNLSLLLFKLVYAVKKSLLTYMFLL